MYIVTEEDDNRTKVRGVFINRSKLNRNLDKILQHAELNSNVVVSTGTLNGILDKPRVIERYTIELVPELRQAVRL